MKILFLTSRLPYPPHGGDRNRIFHFIKKLSEDHQINLISLTNNKTESEENKFYLKKYCVRVSSVVLPQTVSWIKAGLFQSSLIPAQAMYYYSSHMRAAVAEQDGLFKPDVVFFHLFRTLPYLDCVANNSYKILELTDVISKEIFRSLHYRNNVLEKGLLKGEAEKIRRYERFGSTQVNETWVSSEIERLDLIAEGGEGEIVVMPNGLPAESFKTTRKPDEQLLVFFGYSNVQHNKDALSFINHMIKPLLNDKKNIKFIVGGVGWNFTVQPGNILSRATIFLAPLRFSAGIQTKIIEAMAYGVPVVTTSFGNEGIGAVRGKEIIICDNANEFAQQIKYLLDNPDKREEIGRQGQIFARGKFQWEYVSNRMSLVEERLKSQILKPIS